MRILNVVTNLAYPIAGYFGGEVTFIAGIILGAGSAWMHYEEEYRERTNWSILADWFGMYAFTLSFIALHTNYWVLTLLIGFAWLRNDMRDFRLIGLLVLILITISQSWVALALFTIAYYIRQRYEQSEYQDYSHSAWHLLTSIAYYLCLLNAPV